VARRLANGGCSRISPKLGGAIPVTPVSPSSGQVEKGMVTVAVVGGCGVTAVGAGHRVVTAFGELDLVTVAALRSDLLGCGIRADQRVRSWTARRWECCARPGPGPS
jgi:hypothetical protein